MSTDNLAQALADKGLNPDEIAELLSAGEADIVASKPVRKAPSISLGTKDGGKGTVCVYGMSVRPFGSWYPAQWVRFLHYLGAVDTPVHQFIRANADRLSFRTDEEKTLCLEACAPVFEDTDETEES